MELEACLDVLQHNINAINLPNAFSNVFNRECVLSFDTPFSEDGLYTNLKTYEAFGKDWVQQDRIKNSSNVYLLQKWKKVEKEQEEDENEMKDEAPTKLALGVEGGFKLDSQKYDIIKDYYLAIFIGNEEYNFKYQPVVNNEVPDEMDELFNVLPEKYKLVLDAIITHDDAAEQKQAEQWEEVRPESKYAIKDLDRLQDSPFVVSANPDDWECADSGMKKNIWLNLHTGYIGSGRKYFDGSGGTGAAENHFKETGGIYPLVVKLGTITPLGADVYSYAPDEDKMVNDPYLEEHLAFWGINMKEMTKTDKTMTELDIALNMNFQSRILEEGSEAAIVNGPELCGLQNLGNSCYCNSVFQTLFATEDFKMRYYDEQLLLNAPGNPANDLQTQLAKLAFGLYSEKYSTNVNEDGSASISPRMIKTLLGGNHVDFGSKLQQDAHEYYQYVLEQLSRYDIGHGNKANDISFAFKYEVENRKLCNQSNKVNYSYIEENTLAFNVPLDKATNIEAACAWEDKEKLRLAMPVNERGAQEDKVVLEIPFEDVIDFNFETEVIDDFYSSATKAKGTANITRRFRSFPKYLCVQLRRYVLDGIAVKKIDASIPFPEQLDLENYRGTGLQDDEEELPEEVIEADQNIVNNLTMMGFSENACKRAALAVDNSNADAAINWLMGHLDDPDINDPVGPQKVDNNQAVDNEKLMMLTAMGISENHASEGLKATNGDIERAIDWCFSHEEINNMNVDQQQEGPEYQDGPGKYELFSMISHLGRNPGSGHYVAHVKKNGKWYLFNDETVKESIETPLDSGYLYFYKRI
eukprot:TRINITY_DN2084_c0_g1_i4.p1 TRINITY_DN2084_c0_g1~~TRINITY_DN2084_c0_g1_i4.p1  ORF type:complete len:810 (-),score=356.58 TRINITY_DN2084_c0_g1_i4:2009-4438(-)